MELCDKNLCCGCGVCADKCPRHCISMKPDRDGFLFPEIDKDSCVNCGLCEKTCPILHPVADVHEPVTVYAAWSKDDSVRTSSSSGGIFSVLGESVLKENGVINGTAFDGSMVLKHFTAEHPEETVKFCGSKYVQSCTDGIYSKIKDHLKAGRKVLFTSVPCQVAALKAFLGKDYENLITCDILCHGIPSQKFFRAYMKSQCPIPAEHIKSVAFRNTGKWTDYRMAAVGDDGAAWTASGTKNGFISYFLKGAICNNACYHCAYTGKKRIGDITLGDFWGIGRQKHFQHDTGKGCSFVAINTGKGKVLFDGVKDRIFCEERSFAEAAQGNGQLSHPTQRPVIRDTFSEDTFESFFTIPLSIIILRKVKGVLCLPFRILQKCKG